jgi:transcriptional antiterminator NusG
MGDDKLIDHEDEKGEQESSAEKASEAAPLEFQPVLDHPHFKWYIVNTYSGSEETVKIALEERIQKAKFEKFFGSILIPKIQIEKVLKSGKKKIINKTSFPGYLIVQMELNEQSMGCISSTPKVTGFLGDKHSPRAMSQRDVLKILRPPEKEEKFDLAASFKKGDAVRVTDGPFTNFDGVVDEVRSDKMKLKVLVSIFGRETPVELTYKQVDKIS